MDAPKKFPINKESLEGFARQIVYELAGKRIPPVVVDVYSSKDGDRSNVELFHRLLVAAFEEQGQFFHAREKTIPQVRSFLETASDFYSIDLGYYSTSGGIPEHMIRSASEAIPQHTTNQNERGLEIYFNQQPRDEKRILGHISNGTVIDHIPAGKVWKLADILGINQPDYSAVVSLGDNFGSRKFGKKGVLKIEGYELSNKELNSVAFYAEGATVSTIRNGRVNGKLNLQIPSLLEGILFCPESDCLSNIDDKVSSVIKHFSENSHGYECTRCNRSFHSDELKFKGYLKFL
ncbi:Aspartate carbamoyltransferase regulatory chain [uncultured archaeon]|nr:Aspartate carbamoyltransferase regulatory chain [uncultured archaeon]